ncbi:PBP1A family penicillin-binding protein [Rhodospirillaceae bacterium SYSU D60014]|uniref:transglycosylase domain-containing protein n=1 Tax=Virgifigura deserti TaxID=2268457 RepID=UPI000E65F65D
MAQKKTRSANGGRNGARRANANGGGSRARPPRPSPLPFLLKWSLVAMVWAVFLGLCVMAWLAYDLPSVETLDDIDRRPSVTLLTKDGSTLATYGDLYGKSVRLSDLPPYLPQAVLATEDRRFYSHPGVDPIGLARAIYVNLRDWELSQGGSTITQQLAKNIFLTPERTIRRKGQELLLALWLERNFTKDQILSLYLNRVYFGAGTYGVDAAARRFFGKPAAAVNVYEAAMLAGLLKAPSRYNPLSDPEGADARARLVLRNMVAAGYLTDDQATYVARTQAGNGIVTASRTGRYFADWVLDQVSSYVGYTGQDLVVVTTLDPALQRLAEAELARLLEERGTAAEVKQGALVALTPDGAVRAMVGGRAYAHSQFNRATQALRQPGSAFKPFVFLAGMESGLAPESRFVDGPISIGKWKPDNYNDKYHGEVTLREAFARSLNSVAIQVSQRVGPDTVVETAHRLGITSDLNPRPSIALGASEVSLLDLTAAYGVFANQGYGVWPRGIEEIRDTNGVILYSRVGSGPGRLVAPRNVAAMVDLMSAAIEWGTGRSAALERPAAGKTGTSQDFRDAWFVGFTAELVTGVWFGNDDGAPMAAITGGTLPAKLWRAFMSKALEGRPAQALLNPVIAAQQPVPEPTSPAAGRAVAAEAEPEKSSLEEWLERITGLNRKKK